VLEVLSLNPNQGAFGILGSTAAFLLGLLGLGFCILAYIEMAPTS
jgi:hypothetical protein